MYVPAGFGFRLSGGFQHPVQRKCPRVYRLRVTTGPRGALTALGRASQEGRVDPELRGWNLGKAAWGGELPSSESLAYLPGAATPLSICRLRRCGSGAQ